MVRAKPEPAIHPFDRLHGTDTSGLIPGRIIARGTAAKVEELTAYYGVAPSILHGLLDLWLQTTAPAPIQAIDRPAARPRDIEHTVFLDIGAGKGRALLLASQYPFLRVEGVELNPSLVRIAQSNIDLWQRNPLAQPLAPLLLHHADATTHPLPPEPTVAFLFHPFELPILRRFLRHVETTLAARARAKNAQPFHLLYANAEHGSLLDRHPAFTRLWIGNVAMSPADHVADLAAIAEQKEYGSTGDELCAIYRFTGPPRQPPKAHDPARQSPLKSFPSIGPGPISGAPPTHAIKKRRIPGTKSPQPRIPTHASLLGNPASWLEKNDYRQRWSIIMNPRELSHTLDLVGCEL